MNVKGALTRKFGPLPAWGWLALLAGALFFYRRYSATSSGTGTGSVGPAPVTPQAQQILQPGESVYDPNTGALTTAPGGTGTGGTDMGTALDNLANAIANGMPPTQVTVNIPGQPPPGKTKPPGKPPKPPKPPGHHKRKVKTKNKHAKADATQTRSASNLLNNRGRRARSAASVRQHTGGRTTGKSGKSRVKMSLPRGRPFPGLRTLRQRPKTPPVVEVPNQRRVATHPKPGRRVGAAPAPRPSAPGPRTVRSPGRPVGKRGIRRKGP